MNRPGNRRSTRLHGLGGVLLVAVLALGSGVAGCSGHGGDGAGAGTGVSAGTGAGGGSAALPMASMEDHGATALGAPMNAAERSATWEARPAFVSTAGAETQAAYAYALERPDVVQWLPCYCGCAAMDHRSNLDCFFKRRMSSAPISYEEHASFCDVCVKTALMAKGMIGRGATLQEVRAAVDAQFGSNGVPGTRTELPPA